MNSKSYLVKMVAGQSDSTKVWNSRKPLSLGHPARWSLEATETGVRVSSLLDDTRPKLMKDSEIAKTATLVLLPGGKANEGFSIELQPVATVESAYSQSTNDGPALRVFQVKGDWALDSTTLAKKFVAVYEGTKIFTLTGNENGLYAKHDTVGLKILVEGVTINGEAALRGETSRLSHEEMKTLILGYKESEWKVSPYTPSQEAFAAAQEKDEEQKLFFKTLKTTAASILFLFALSFVLPSAEPEKKEEKVQILLTPKKVKGLMTAAPKGDANSKDFSIGKNGIARNAGRKGGNSMKSKPQNTAKAEKARAKKSTKMASRKAPAAKGTAKRGAAPTKVAQKNSSRPKSVPQAPRSELFKTFSSAAFRKASQSLATGGMANGLRGAGDSAAEARSIGNSSGSGRGAIGSAGGISTRSGHVSGLGGGNGDGGPGSAGAGYGRGSYSKVSGQGRSLVSLDTGASDVDEGLTRDQVGRVIHAHMNEIRYCYESAVLRENSIEGKMHVEFSIGAPGNVRTAGVGSSTVGDRRLHNCIVGHLKTWKFPKPKGGVTVAVSYPFMFKTLTR